MAEHLGVGARIRQLRESRQLTVDELAERSQINPKVIEHLESGDLVSSISPLLKIARGLGVRLGVLMDEAPSSGPIVSRAGQAQTTVEFSGFGPHTYSTLDFHPLAKNKKERHMEPFIVDIHPSVPEDCTFSFHDGEEFMFVLAGEIEVLYGNERHVLGVGDSIYYDSTTPHQVQAVGDNDAKILAVIYT